MKTPMPRLAPLPIQNILAASERVNWSVEDLNRRQQTSRLQAASAKIAAARRIESLEFLKPLALDGHDYLYIFGLVEEFILPFVLDHARPILHGNDARVRAFLNFRREAKHIDLF